MFRTLLHSLLRSWLKGKSRFAKQGCKSRCRFKPTVEALENRVVLSFTAASSISVGSRRGSRNANSLNVSAFTSRKFPATSETSTTVSPWSERIAS